MELTKNIFFNTDKLIENSIVKISYTGKLFQEGSEEVNIHYGFGLSWDKLNEIKMTKTELGFQAEIELPSAEYNTFNFCFNNGNGAWDNNNCQNYVFLIEKLPQELIEISQAPAFLDTTKRLSRAYIWNKKIRLAVYKIITYLPKIISGNYKKKTVEEKQ